MPGSELLFGHINLNLFFGLNLLWNKYVTLLEVTPALPGPNHVRGHEPGLFC